MKQDLEGVRAALGSEEQVSVQALALISSKVDPGNLILNTYRKPASAYFSASNGPTRFTLLS